MNLEWSVFHKIQSRYGDLLLNVADGTTGRIYRIQGDSYKIVPSLRVTQDNISQAHGSVLHPRWKTGVVAIIQVALNVMLDPSSSCGEARPACEGEMREMEEELLLHLNSMEELSTNPLVNQRLIWTPTGYGDDRLIDDVQLLEIWEPSYDLDGTEALIQFALESPFPYGIDATEIQTTLLNGASQVVVNNGNCSQSPVVRVNGPFSGFTLTNQSDLDQFGAPLSVVYNGARPGASNVGGGHYIELDFFRGTAVLDGDVANRIAGLDPTLTDFWHLNPGNNTLLLSGAPSALVLSNNTLA